MPDVWVFPGGRVEPADAVHPIASPMQRGEARRLEARWPSARVRALGCAAIRETFEETGLAIGELASDRHLKPDLGALTYLGRAITPTESAIRYHARFFMASADRAKGRLRGNGELIDLEWVPIRRALELPIIDVTTEILLHVEQLTQGRRVEGSPFVHYRRGARFVDRE